ncbi:MAG: hypothetical protein EU539_03815 [Promethearchaeota archaeon]|nr:MAG: hypothetical protein EU539_03815 [Candidatus Lokiarchaeota archaeon]
MEHENLTLEHDKNLINKILDDINMRYIILFLYIIRNDLFEDLKNQKTIDSYERVIILDDIYKKNVLDFWDENFIEIAIDLGLFKNIRSMREFRQKDEDFLLRMGEKTITVENKTIMTPEEILFLFITKKFQFLTKRNFNLAITRLKAVRCEVSSNIHSFIFEIGENEYTLSDDLYYILDQFGNIYQAIKIELTIEGFYQKFQELSKKINDFIEIFDPVLNSKPVLNKIHNYLQENKDIMKSLKDDKIKLSDKFNIEKIDKNAEIFKKWNSSLLQLLTYRNDIQKVKDKLLEIKKYYSGKDKTNTYLEFIEKVSFNEDNIVNEIQDTLLSLREKVISINNEISKKHEKDIKLLNLDYERFLITSGGE